MGDYIPGPFESSKFQHLREGYHQGVEEIKALGYTTEDLIQNWPCFCGHLTLARFLSLNEVYQRTLGVCGHIAEIGVWRGAVTSFYAKLIQIYEPHALTQVHAFDWFEGTKATEEDPQLTPGSYAESLERVTRLFKSQRIDHIAKLHQLDASKEIGAFFERHPHLQFKIVFFDAGQYYIVKHALPYFWDRLTPGGILVLDQFNFDIAPGETRAVKELLPDRPIRTFPNGWMPTAYIVK